jgi:hypothetical protein
LANGNLTFDDTFTYGYDAENIAVGIVGEHLRARIRIGRGKPVEPIRGKACYREREKWRIKP